MRSSRPTTPASLTAEGTILGTFQYMAPEQLEGKDADARTDIFAFGAVVYEMLTGKKAFEGKSQAGLIGAIMHARARCDLRQSATHTACPRSHRQGLPGERAGRSVAERARSVS